MVPAFELTQPDLATHSAQLLDPGELNVPASHVVQLSPFVVYVPPAQRAQETLPSVVAYFPSMHASQAELVTADAYLPLGHAVQTAEPVEEKVPATHKRQSLSVSCASTEAPGSLRYLPEAQSVHVPVPGDTANVPAAHVKHWLNDTWDDADSDFPSSDRYVPAEQFAQSARASWSEEEVAGSALYVPMGQIVHSERASWSEEEVAGSALYVPMGHIVQSERASWRDAAVPASDR